MTLTLGLIGLATTATVLRWRLSRLEKFAVLLAAFTLVADGVVSGRSLSFSPTLRARLLDHATVTTTLIVSIAFIGLLALLLHLAPSPRGTARRSAGRASSTVAAWVAIAVLTVPFATLAARIGNVGPQSFTQARQQYIDSGMVRLGFYCSPLMAILAWGVFRHRTAKLLTKSLAGLLAVLATGVTYASGSRTNLILVVLLPISHFEWVSARALSAPRRRRVKRRTALISGCAALLGVLTVLSNRGALDDFTAFSSADISQYDVAALVVERASCCEATLLAPVTRPLARLGVPSTRSGNQVVSEEFFSSRYEATRSEVAAGLIGEAIINVGVLWAAPLAALVFAMGFVALRWLYWASANDPLKALLVLAAAYRFLSLLRSDVLNVSVPLLLIGVVGIGLSLRPRRSALRPGRRIEPHVVRTLQNLDVR